MDNQLVIYIKDTADVFVDIAEKGTVITKQISPNSLISCFEKSIIGKPVISSGLLPTGCLCCNIKPDDNSYYCVLDFQDRQADITYMDTVYKNFPLPHLVFGFSVENSGRVSEVNLGVTENGKLNENSQMYYYPFSNVNVFKMCVGLNALPRIKKPSSLSNLPYYILSLPDNDDIFSTEYNRPGLGRRDLMELISNKTDEYYYSAVLKPMKDTTLKNFLEV